MHPHQKLSQALLEWGLAPSPQRRAHLIACADAITRSNSRFYTPLVRIAVKLVEVEIATPPHHSDSAELKKIAISVGAAILQGYRTRQKNACNALAPIINLKAAAKNANL